MPHRAFFGQAGSVLVVLFAGVGELIALQAWRVRDRLSARRDGRRISWRGHQALVQWQACTPQDRTHRGPDT